MGLDLRYTVPAQHAITAGQKIDDLNDLKELDHLDHLDHLADLDDPTI